MVRALTVLVALLGIVFAAGAVLKTLIWWKSLAWALQNGHSYAQAVQQPQLQQTLTRDDRLDLIEQHNGAFRPCGAKSVRLRGIRTSRAGRLLDLTFVKTPVFIFEGAVLSLVASLMHSSTPAKVVASVLAIWICVYSLMLIIEAIVWYIIAKEYALVWGDLKFATKYSGQASRTLGDFKGLGAVTLTAVLACSVLISVTAQSASAYVNLAPSSADTLGIPTLISSTYYVLATLTTVGDNAIAPHSVLARAAAGLLHLMVLLTVGFAISAISARVQDRQ